MLPQEVLDFVVELRLHYRHFRMKLVFNRVKRLNCCRHVVVALPRGALVHGVPVNNAGHAGEVAHVLETKGNEGHGVETSIETSTWLWVVRILLPEGRCWVGGCCSHALLDVRIRGGRFDAPPQAGEQRRNWVLEQETDATAHLLQCTRLLKYQCKLWIL